MSRGHVLGSWWSSCRWSLQRRRSVVFLCVRASAGECIRAQSASSPGCTSRWCSRRRMWRRAAGAGASCARLRGAGAYGRPFGPPLFGWLASACGRPPSVRWCPPGLCRPPPTPRKSARDLRQKESFGHLFPHAIYAKSKSACELHQKNSFGRSLPHATSAEREVTSKRGC